MGLFKRKPKYPEELAEIQAEQIEIRQDGKETIREDGTPATSLFFHPDWEMSTAERYVYRYHHQNLAPLLPNQLSITGLELKELNGDLVVVAFLRNTLDRGIRFETVDLLLLDSEGTPFAKKQFEVDDIGEIPAFSCMPWRFLFFEEDRLGEALPEEWTIAFELKSNTAKEHALDIDERWGSSLTPAQREHLETMVAGLPKLAAGEVNIMGIEASMKDDGSLAAVVLIRNGSEKSIKLEQIPLVVEDAEGDIVARGGFTLQDLEVKANTSKPWTFVFPAGLITKEAPQLEKWKVYPPGN
ncbi:accessory Sec system S-layer assembly protein [Peribacillus sp. SCS-155]|uniref:accessory Sec system S-layer assembly protein n=1 Tax=Peribacillus sedimenti TaxID=3115297 RepID=UPI0039058A29